MVPRDFQFVSMSRGLRVPEHHVAHGFCGATPSQSLSLLASHVHGSSVLLLQPTIGDPAQTPCVCGESLITVNVDKEAREYLQV